MLEDCEGRFRWDANNLSIWAPKRGHELKGWGKITKWNPFFYRSEAGRPWPPLLSTHSLCLQASRQRTYTVGGAPRQFSLNLKLAWQDEKCNKTKKKTVCSQRPSKRWLDTAELLSCSTVQSNVSGHKLITIIWIILSSFYFLHHCIFCGFKFRFKWNCTDRVCMVVCLFVGSDSLPFAQRQLGQVPSQVTE